MAVREKRSISLTPELAAAIDEEAENEGLSVSAWIAKTVEHQLRIKRGLEAVAEEEREFGPFPEELKAEARARVRQLIAEEARVYGL